MVAAPLVFCAHCGRWSTGHSVLKLSEECAGPIRGKDHGGYRARLRNMEAGLHPLTLAPLGSLPLPLLRGLH